MPPVQLLANIHHAMPPRQAFAIIVLTLSPSPAAISLAFELSFSLADYFDFSMPPFHADFHAIERR
jgi:hypothetical protein